MSIMTENLPTEPLSDEVDEVVRISLEVTVAVNKSRTIFDAMDVARSLRDGAAPYGTVVGVIKCGRKQYPL